MPIAYVLPGSWEWVMREHVAGVMNVRAVAPVIPIFRAVALVKIEQVPPSLTRRIEKVRSE